jgi:hypothetical protein
VDFVALISDGINIRSAKVFGNSNASNYGVAGIGFATVPEPPGIILAGYALLGVFAWLLQRSLRTGKMI